MPIKIRSTATRFYLLFTPLRWSSKLRFVSIGFSRKIRLKILISFTSRSLSMGIGTSLQCSQAFHSLLLMISWWTYSVYLFLLIFYSLGDILTACVTQYSGGISFKLKCPANSINFLFPFTNLVLDLQKFKK